MSNTNKSANMEQLSPVLKQTFFEWCKSSTTHGAPNIIKAENKALRLIWIVCLVASSCFCLYLISLSIMSYTSNPVKTLISVVDEVPARFPTISICNLNPFKTDDPKVNSKINQVVSALNISLSNESMSLYMGSVTKQMMYFFYNLNDSEKQSFGNQLDDMLFSCTFNTRSCGLRDFEWFYDFNLGNCYQFNPRGNLTVGKAGYVPGLRIQLSVGDSASSYTYLFQTGLRILVHNSSLSKPMIYDFGVNVAPGSRTDIQVSRINYRKLPSPYSTCLEDLTRNSPVEIKSYTMNIMFDALNITTYNRDYCQNLYFQAILEQNCGCVDPSFSYRPNFPERCIDDIQILCQQTMFIKVYADPDYYMGSECPKECDYFKYELKLSHSAFPTEWYWNATVLNSANLPNTYLTYRMINMTNDYKTAKDNFLAVNIFYSELSYTLIKEEPLWDIFALFSSIGGNLGLFVGMSFLSFVEILEIAYQLAELYFMHLKEKNKRVLPDNRAFN